MKIDAKRYQNVLEFLKGSYPVSLNPSPGLKLQVITDEFNVYNGVYQGLGVYECEGAFSESENILAWKYLSGAGKAVHVALQRLKEYEEEIQKISVVSGVAAEKIAESVEKFAAVSTLSCSEIISQLNYLNTHYESKKITFKPEEISLCITRLNSERLISVSKIQQKTGNPIDAILKKRKW